MILLRETEAECLAGALRARLDSVLQKLIQWLITRVAA